MSTNIPVDRRKQISAHRGGVFYELAGHMLDQIIWILGRPASAACFLRTDDHGTGQRVEGFADNTLGVFEFGRGHGNRGHRRDGNAADGPPLRSLRHRRQRYHRRALRTGSLIRLCLAEDTAEYAAGVQMVPFQGRSRQELYHRELKAFLRAIAGEQEPDRRPEHDLLVQETLLRAVGTLVD